MTGDTTTALDVEKPPVHLAGEFKDVAPGQNINLPWMKILQLDITSLESLHDIKFAAADDYELSNVYNMVAEGSVLDSREPAPATFDAEPAPMMHLG